MIYLDDVDCCVSNNITNEILWVSSSGCNYCGNVKEKPFLTIFHAVFIAGEPKKIQMIRYEISRSWKRIKAIIKGEIT